MGGKGGEKRRGRKGANGWMYESLFRQIVFRFFWGLILTVNLRSPRSLSLARVAMRHFELVGENATSLFPVKRSVRSRSRNCPFLPPIPHIKNLPDPKKPTSMEIREVTSGKKM